jgi:hypothetical protein
MPLTRRLLWEASAIAVAVFTLSMVLRRFTGVEGLLLANQQPLFGDFLALWTGGKLAIAGQTAALYQEAASRALQHDLIPGFIRVAPYYSPPVFLLLLAPLAALPYPVAAVIFLALSAGVYGVAARLLLPDRRAMIFAATLPVALLHLINLQTGLLVAGLTGLALFWLDKRPLTAGAMIALLAIKPHLALAWPLMLAVRGRWKAFLAALAGVAVLILVAGAIFGFDVYPAFLANLKTAQGAVDQARVGANVYASLYANLLMEGALPPFALAAHGISLAGALALSVLIWRRGESATSAAALCALTMLISPYLFYYDTPLLALGALVLAPGASRLEQYALAFAWAAGLLALAISDFPFCPAAAWALMAIAARRSGVLAWRRGPQPETPK